MEVVSGVGRTKCLSRNPHPLSLTMLSVHCYSNSISTVTLVLFLTFVCSFSSVVLVLRNAILCVRAWNRDSHTCGITHNSALHCSYLNIPYFFIYRWTHDTEFVFPSSGLCSLCLTSSQVSWKGFVFPAALSAVEAPFLPHLSIVILCWG